MCTSHNLLFSYMQSLKFCHSTSEKLQNVSDQQICLIFVQKSTSVNILQLLGSFDTDSVLGHHCELGLRPSVTFSLIRSPLTVPTLVFVHFNDWMYTNKPYTNYFMYFMLLTWLQEFKNAIHASFCSYHLEI